MLCSTTSTKESMGHPASISMKIGNYRYCVKRSGSIVGAYIIGIK